jgi:hypothetical protein
VLVLNALLGLGTALAPVQVAAFVGLGFWWGPPIVSTVLLVALLVSLRLPGSMALLSFFFTRRRPARAELMAAGAGS